jgi:hypothetical protein
MVDDKFVAQAALELWEDCANLSPEVPGLSSDDIAGILHGMGDPAIQGSSANANNSDTDVVDGLSDESGDTIGEGEDCGDREAANPPPPSLPAAGGKSSRLTFVMNRGRTGNWIFTPMESYNLHWRKQLLNTLPERHKFLLLGHSLFGPAMVLNLASVRVTELSQPLAAVFEMCRGRFWDRPSSASASLSNVMKNPPRELSEAISEETFCGEYDRLRQWLRGVDDLPFGHEFFNATGFRVQILDEQDQLLGDPFAISPKEIMDSWPPRYVPPRGTQITSRTFGRCRLLDVSRSPDMDKFYEYAMSTPLAEIRHRGIWHVIVAWHFYVHAATSSESLAESVGSFLNLFRHRNTNGGLHTKRIAWGAHLRSAGLRGLGGEDGILAMALNMHFRCRSPDGWHFQTKTVKPAAGGAKGAHLRREVELLRRPLWFGTPLVDLVKSGQIDLCKSLPWPDQFMLSRQECKREAPQCATKRRRTLEQMADKSYEPDHMDQSLWQRLGISVLSLPGHLRPGTNPR